MTDEFRLKAEARLQHTFSKPQVLKEALTHASLADSRLQSNERLEFLGDAVLDLVVCEELFIRFPQYLEGELTKVKSAVVSRRTCAEVAKEAGLADVLLTGKGLSNQRALPNSLLAAVYESVVAAIYLDGGFEAARKFIIRTMGTKIDAISANEHQHNYKAVLQQHAQRDLGGTPQYELIDEKGPDHSKCFEVSVNVRGRHFPSAWGANKKTAEQKAAVRALEELGVLTAQEVDEAMNQLTATEPATV